MLESHNLLYDGGDKAVFAQVPGVVMQKLVETLVVGLRQWDTNDEWTANRVTTLFTRQLV